MNAEFFKIIKEINSLEQKVFSLNSLKAQDRQRISRLFEHKEQRHEKLKDHLKEIQNLRTLSVHIDNSINENDKKIQEYNSQLNSIFDQNLQDRIQENLEQAQNNNEKLQEEGLTTLEKIEEIEQEIIDSQNFLKGIDETIDEIKAEISQEQTIQDTSITNVHERIEDLLSDLSEDFRTQYLKLKAKAPTTNTLSIIFEERCSHCGFQIPHQKAEMILNLKSLCSCEMCQRIFIPKHSAY